VLENRNDEENAKHKKNCCHLTLNCIYGADVFYYTTLVAKRSYVYSVHVTVALSVRLSVTFVFCVDTAGL